MAVTSNACRGWYPPMDDHAMQNSKPNLRPRIIYNYALSKPTRPEYSNSRHKFYQIWSWVIQFSIQSLPLLPEVCNSIHWVSNSIHGVCNSMHGSLQFYTLGLQLYAWGSVIIYIGYPIIYMGSPITDMRSPILGIISYFDDFVPFGRPYRRPYKLMILCITSRRSG